jgi:hypothetical protein
VQRNRQFRKLTSPPVGRRTSAVRRRPELARQLKRDGAMAAFTFATLPPVAAFEVGEGCERDRQFRKLQDRVSPVCSQEMQSRGSSGVPPYCDRTSRSPGLDYFVRRTIQPGSGQKHCPQFVSPGACGVRIA